MAKHKIVFEKNIDRTNEQEIINEIQKNEFFNWMKKNNFSFDDIKEIIDNNNYISASEQNRFNLTLRRAKKEINISLTESIIFLEETFAKFKKILAVLDGETRYELKKELATNYKIKLDNNNLSQILE